MLTFMLSALFFGLFVYFGECETDRVLVTSTLALDGPVSNCAPTYLLHNEKVVLDRHGRWEGEAGHQVSQSTRCFTVCDSVSWDTTASNSLVSALQGGLELGDLFTAALLTKLAHFVDISIVYSAQERG